MGSHLLGESFLPCLSLSLPLRATVLVFAVVIEGASADSICHELSEYVWLYGSVKHRKLII